MTNTNGIGRARNAARSRRKKIGYPAQRAANLVLIRRCQRRRKALHRAPVSAGRFIQTILPRASVALSMMSMGANLRGPSSRRFYQNARYSTRGLLASGLANPAFGGYISRSQNCTKGVPTSQDVRMKISPTSQVVAAGDRLDGYSRTQEPLSTQTLLRPNLPN